MLGRHDALPVWRGGICCASGHASQILAFFALMEPGDRFIASTRLYGGPITQFGKTFKTFDWHADFVDVDDIDAVRRAMTSRTKAIFVERSEERRVGKECVSKCRYVWLP